jgi:hypothetical protein
MFDSAKQKIERADYHIADVERQFAAFVAEKPHRLSIKIDPGTGSLAIGIRFNKELPRQFAPIIADAIHNLRTALDHAVWDLVGTDNGTQDRYLQFPAYDTRTKFEAACKGLKTPSQWVKDAISATEAFVNGKGWDLYQLCQLDNSDKHVAITSVLRQTTHPGFQIIAPDGTVQERIERNTFTPAASGVTIATLMKIQPGLSAEIDDDAGCAPSIFIVHSAGTVISPAIPTLRRYSELVTTTVNDFEKAIP